MDTQELSRISSDSHLFQYNFFENNLALGHQYQYAELFGYVQPKQNLKQDFHGSNNLMNWQEIPIERYDVENSEFNKRPKRQVILLNFL